MLTLERAQRHLIIGALVMIAALSWAYTVYLARAMPPMSDAMQSMTLLTQTQLTAWGWKQFFLAFAMWAVMMAAMMVPSAIPMVLFYARLRRGRHSDMALYGPTTLFSVGYLMVWTGFSFIATLLQWALHDAALLSPTMTQVGPMFGGILLIGAGVFQWTSLKSVCLRHCRTPLGFLMSRWRDGRAGPLFMGLEHGAYCTGCCGALMLVLFAVGVMNLLWVAALSALVLTEKIMPSGRWLGRAAGLGLASWGMWMVLTQVAYG